MPWYMIFSSFIMKDNLEIHQADGSLKMHQVAMGTYLYILPGFVQKEMMFATAISMQQ